MRYAMFIISILLGGVFAAFCGAQTFAESAPGKLDPVAYYWDGVVGASPEGKPVLGASAEYTAVENTGYWRVRVGAFEDVMFYSAGDGGFVKDWQILNPFDASQVMVQVSFYDLPGGHAVLEVWNLDAGVKLFGLRGGAAPRVAYRWERGDFTALWYCAVGGAMGAAMVYVLFFWLLLDAMKQLFRLVG